MQAFMSGVRFVRWPIEAGILSECRRDKTPCLLVVEGKAKAPICTEPWEDWIRTPAPQQDIEARVKSLIQRTHGSMIPIVDSTGVLHFGKDSIPISSSQVSLMDQFIAHFEELVYRAELEQCALQQSKGITRNALDLQIMRLRRRISAIGLDLTTVWGRGYILEPRTD